MTNVSNLIHDWEDHLTQARAVCAETGTESSACEIAWEAAKELDIHFESATPPSSPTQD